MVALKSVKFKMESFAITGIWVFPFSCYMPSLSGTGVEKVKQVFSDFPPTFV